jgi:hypothetical protein
MMEIAWNVGLFSSTTTSSAHFRSKFLKLSMGWCGVSVINRDCIAQVQVADPKSLYLKGSNCLSWRTCRTGFRIKTGSPRKKKARVIKEAG